MRLHVLEYGVKPKKLLETVRVPTGMTLAEYLAKRLNEVGSMERLAVELGVAYGTLYNTCQALGIAKRSEYYVQAEAERVS